MFHNQVLHLIARLQHLRTQLHFITKLLHLITKLLRLITKLSYFITELSCLITKLINLITKLFPFHYQVTTFHNPVIKLDNQIIAFDDNRVIPPDNKVTTTYIIQDQLLAFADNRVIPLDITKLLLHLLSKISCLLELSLASSPGRHGLLVMYNERVIRSSGSVTQRRGTSSTSGGSGGSVTHGRRDVGPSPTAQTAVQLTGRCSPAVWGVAALEDTKDQC